MPNLLSKFQYLSKFSKLTAAHLSRSVRESPSKVAKEGSSRTNRCLYSGTRLQGLPPRSRSDKQDSVQSVCTAASRLAMAFLYKLIVAGQGLHHYCKAVWLIQAFMHFRTLSCPGDSLSH